MTPPLPVEAVPVEGESVLGGGTFLHSLLEVGVQFLTSTSSSPQLVVVGRGGADGEVSCVSSKSYSKHDSAPRRRRRRSPGALPAHLARLLGGAEPAGLALALGVVSGSAGHHGVLV